MTVAAPTDNTGLQQNDAQTQTPERIEEDVKLVGEKPLLNEQAERDGTTAILDALTDAEKANLADPNMAVRHLRAEKGKVKQATKKIKQTLAWRKDFQVEAIKSCCYNNGKNGMRSVMLKENETGKMYVRGYDKEGRAILYMRPVLENTHDEIGNMRHLVHAVERAVACTARKSGLEKFVIVIDYDKFRLSDAPPLSTSKHTLKILQDHYPERLHRAYLFNPPLIFRTTWNLLKPFIDPVTKQKIVFCHGKTGMKEMEDHFDMTTIERYAGGRGGTDGWKEFKSKEYLLSTPFDVSFGEDWKR